MTRSSIVLTFLFVGEIFSMQVAAQELCPGSGPLETPMRRPGSTIPDPCDALRILLPVVTKCAAEFPETRELQVHAARILLLERQRKIDIGVLSSMRKMLESQQLSQTLNIDPITWARRIEIAEAGAAKTEADLAAQRQRAVAAGYDQLSKSGLAQKIISSAVWRHIETDARGFLNSCADDAGRQAAVQFIGNFAIMMSHGNGFEREIIRRILDSAPK